MNADVLVLKVWKDPDVELGALLEVGDLETDCNEKWAFTVFVATRAICLCGINRDRRPLPPERAWGFMWGRSGLTRFWNWSD